MTSEELLTGLQSLPISERLTIIEAVLGDITDLDKAKRRAKRFDMKKRLAAAAEKAKPFYESDHELTAFTSLDSEDFVDYE